MEKKLQKAEIFRKGAGSYSEYKIEESLAWLFGNSRWPPNKMAARRHLAAILNYQKAKPGTRREKLVLESGHLPSTSLKISAFYNFFPFRCLMLLAYNLSMGLMGFLSKMTPITPLEEKLHLFPNLSQRTPQLSCHYWHWKKSQFHF